MTGGQANDGGLTVPQIAAQVAAEGAKRIVVVTDEPWKYADNTEWPRGLTVHHRDELDTVQRQMATVPGMSVLIYDQTCAAERRRRKRGTFPDPEKHVVAIGSFLLWVLIVLLRDRRAVLGAADTYERRRHVLSGAALGHFVAARQHLGVRHLGIAGRTRDRLVRAAGQRRSRSGTAVPPLSFTTSLTSVRSRARRRW